MKIEKNYDSFKEILKDKNKAQSLMGATFWQSPLFWMYVRKIDINQESINVKFYMSKWLYDAEFLKDDETEYIELSDSTLFYFANKLIYKRINKNWDKINQL